MHETKEDLDRYKKNDLSSSLEKNKEEIESIFHKTIDFMAIDVKVASNPGKLCYLKTMIDSTKMAEKILHPLSLVITRSKEIKHDLPFKMVENIFSGGEIKTISNFGDAATDILNGYAILLIEGCRKAIAISIPTSDKRSINEPSTQTTIRGPKDGFIEDLYTNLGLLRKRIKSPHLCFDSYIIGNDSSTEVVVAYMENIINNDLLAEVKKRIKDIDVFAIFESNNIEELIADKTFTPFPLLFNTERPDTIASHILTGKVAIFVDGTPFVLSVPANFTDFFSTSEDYYQPYFMGSFIRLLRYFSFLLALLLPSFYVAIITFHHEMIPTTLLINIISQRENVPFPAVVEAIIMELTFEILREAGVRMPRAVGQTVSIVGGLVIGQAAVEAGIISNVMVIIVSLTAIASFVAPIYSFAIASRILRFSFIILAGSLGFFGMMIGLMLMIGHLNSLRSFGVAYLTPVTPFRVKDQEDIFLRLPYWANQYRPTYLQTKDAKKQKEKSSPTPPPLKGEN